MNKPKDPTRRCELRFQEDYHNLEALTTEISSCLVVGDTLFASYDEDAGIEKLTPDSDHYDNHHHYPLAAFFDLPADDEMDIESLAYCEPYL